MQVSEILRRKAQIIALAARGTVALRSGNLERADDLATRGIAIANRSLAGAAITDLLAGPAIALANATDEATFLARKVRADRVTDLA